MNRPTLSTHGLKFKDLKEAKVNLTNLISHTSSVPYKQLYPLKSLMRKKAIIT